MRLIRRLARHFLNPSLVFERRVQQLQFWRGRSHIIARILSLHLRSSFGCYISPTAVIQHGVQFPHPVGIVIGEGVIVESDCVIYQNVTLGRRNVRRAVYPHIGAGTVLYAGAIVIGNSVLGSDSVVGANAIVSDWKGSVGDVLAGANAALVSRRTPSPLNRLS